MDNSDLQQYCHTRNTSDLYVSARALASSLIPSRSRLLELLDMHYRCGLPCSAHPHIATAMLFPSVKPETL